MSNNVTLKLKYQDLTLTLTEGVAADPKLLDGGHPLYYCFKNPHQTEAYLNCVTELLEGLPKGMRVLELCGGIGLVAACVGPRILPKAWTSVELDASCEPLYLKQDWNNFQLANMYDVRGFDYDLVVCEFSNNTLPKMWREPARKELLKRIAFDRPRYWYIADVGYYWIHLANHWPIYQERFGVQVTRQNYHELFDRFMRENYGYKVIKWTVGGGAQYFLMEAV
jgi:hypothetical protein